MDHVGIPISQFPYLTPLPQSAYGWFHPFNFSQVELVLVSGEDGLCGHVLLYLGGGFGTYLHEVEGVTEKQLMWLSGNEFGSFLVRRGLKVLARKSILISRSAEFLNALAEEQNRYSSGIAVAEGYGVTKISQLLQAGGNSWDLPQPLDPTSRGMRNYFDRAFHEVAFLPTYPMKIENASLISASGLQVLRELLASANLEGCTITSGYRDAKAQARVMYENLKKYGIAHQYRLYGVNGDKVVKVYELNATKPRDEVLELMQKKITEVGADKISHHCLTTHDVFDIAPDTILNKKRFEASVKKHPRVSRFLMPPDDPAYHLEIPKR